MKDRPVRKSEESIEEYLKGIDAEGKLLHIVPKKEYRSFKESPYGFIEWYYYGKDEPIRGVAFVPESSSTNTRLHELGHFKSCSSEDFWSRDNYRSSIKEELEAEKYVWDIRGRKDIPWKILVSLGGEVVSNYSITPRTASHEIYRQLRRLGYRFNALKRSKLEEDIIGW